MAWYLVVGLGGIIIGLIGGVLVDRDTVNKYYNKIRKVKVKGDDNTVTDLVDVTIKKESRKSRRQIRRENRQKIKSNGCCGSCSNNP